MTEPLSKEQLAAICARADAATPGPWEAVISEAFEYHWVVIPDEQEMLETVCDVGAPVSPRAKEDAEFIANARADIPALLAHIDALEAERNRLQQAVNEAWDITSEPISSEVEMHPRIIQIMDALQDALSKPTLDKYNVKLD